MSDTLKNKNIHLKSLGLARAERYGVKAGAWHTLKCLANMAALVSGTAGSVAAMEAITHTVLAAEETSLAQEAQEQGRTGAPFFKKAAAYRTQRNTELKLVLALWTVSGLCAWGAQKSGEKIHNYPSITRKVQNSLVH